MKRKLLLFGIICITSILMLMTVVPGQNSNPEMRTVNKHSRPDPNPVLVERFEKIIKNKEKKFSGERLVVNKDDDRAFGMLSWKLHKDYVEVRISDYYSLEEALKHMGSMTDTGKRGGQVVLTKLTNLGDEAYIVIHNYPPQSPDIEMGVRKGNVVLRISSTNPIFAKRFAKYFVREIEERDKEQNDSFQSKNSPLVERFEKVIKNKEKRFTQHNITKTERQFNRNTSTIVWRFGEVGVQAYFLEFDNEPGAIDYLYRGYINNPKDVSGDGRSKLTNLGDEAYITPNMYNKGSKNVSMLVRKGSVFVLIYASDQVLGKRFAEYFVREIEKRDRGDP